MTRQDTLRLLERMLELGTNSLAGQERLREQVPWDSMSSLAFIAEVDREFGLPLPGSQVAGCKTVEDLLVLVEAAVARRAPPDARINRRNTVIAAIRAVEYHLPERVLTNEELAREFPDWPAEKIADKTGIERRHLAADGECASDLAVAAARNLFTGGACRPDQIDFLLLCTQSPDHFLPTTACLLQDRLGIPTTAGTLDFNLGCSGFVYGLSLAKGLIETGQAANVLLLTAETYSKFLDRPDRGVRSLFGDAAAATLVQGRQDSAPGLPWIGPFVFGTDGKGKENLIVPAGGMRQPASAPGTLYMNGPAIFSFTLEAVPRAVHDLLQSAGRTLGDVDRFVFHQANRYMLEYLRNKLKIPPERFVLAMSHCGNTVSSTIPIALAEAERRGELSAGELVMLVGFGVGYSWAATLVRWAGVAPPAPPLR